MEKGFKAGLMAVVALAFVSCSSGMYDSLSRTTDDPVTEKPTVTSFEVESAILVTWEKDEAADEYILERSDDLRTPVYQRIYAGTELVYTDTSLEEEGRYLYRIMKRRGEKTFSASAPVLGVCSSVCKDGDEPNGMRQNAIEIINDHNANMYFYKSNSGLRVSDDDWYCVTILPRMKALIKVTDLNAPYGIDATHFKVYKSALLDDDVVTGGFIEIENRKYVTETYYFKLFPNEEIYLRDGEGLEIVAGGAIVPYTVALYGMVTISGV